MARKKIVAGNWKMNTLFAEAETLVKQVLLSNKDNENVSKIFFPPSPFLKLVADMTASSVSFNCGAQNCSEHEKGAYTGEISAAMLASVGCKYALVGHSERRTYFGENDKQLVAKIKQAIKNNITPVFCFGEVLSDRKNNKHFEVVKNQLSEVLKNFSASQVQNFVLAYEPVWAIGTGETASPQQAQEMHKFIRECLADLFNSQPVTDISILYGGSCNAQNAPELFACPDVDGGLIGGASLKADDFCKIIDSF